MEDDLADFIGEIGYSSCSRYFFDFLNFAFVSNIIIITLLYWLTPRAYECLCTLSTILKVIINLFFTRSNIAT